jgi:hypothetical protein
VQKGVRFTLRIVFDEDFEGFQGGEVLKVLCTLVPESSQGEEGEISLEMVV